MATVLKIWKTFNKNKGKQIVMLLLNAFFHFFCYIALQLLYIQLWAGITVKIRFQSTFKYLIGIYTTVSCCLKWLHVNQCVTQQEFLCMIWL